MAYLHCGTFFDLSWFIEGHLPGEVTLSDHGGGGRSNAPPPQQAVENPEAQQGAG